MSRERDTDRSEADMKLWPEDQAEALTLLRRIWLLSLSWHTLLLVVGVLVAGVWRWLSWTTVGMWLAGVAAGLLVLGLPIAGYVRMQFYKRYWQGQAVASEGYVSGNLTVVVVVDLVVTFAVLAAVLSSDLLWLIPGVVAWGLEGANWPSGLPMQPQGPRL